jgi:hypothetical protein
VRVSLVRRDVDDLGVVDVALGQRAAAQVQTVVRAAMQAEEGEQALLPGR